MTDISESGIEAARKAYGNLSSRDANPDALRAAIQAYLPFHPPASREEGLRVKALEWGKEYSERTDGSGYFSVEAQTIVGRYSAYRMDATRQWILEFERAVLGAFDEVAAYRAAAQEHYTNAVLNAIEIIPTKPEAKEEGFPWEISPDAWRQVVERIVKETERVYGPGPVVNAVRAALQSKKPE